LAITIRTGRGAYELKLAAPTERSTDAFVLTIALDRSDGIERVAFRCRIARELVDDDPSDDALTARLAAWLEREFEMTRETALKTIRSERRLHEFQFDASNRRPF
jgi:hypothetical protein